MENNTFCSAAGGSNGNEEKGEELVINIPLINEPARRRECCIYRVPNKLRMVNKEAYTPKLVSIGPFHHDLEELKGMERKKQIYFTEFCSRPGKSQNDLACITVKEVEKIRHYYSDTFGQFDNTKFWKIILLDAIFIIELFLRNSEGKKHDYILGNSWLESHIKQDLILLENQLPFEILKKLYESAFNGEVTSFLELACQFFFSDNHRIPIDNTEVKHFTDLHRIFYRPTDRNLAPKKLTEHLRYTATKLDEAGLQFKALVDIDFSEKSLLDIEFHKHKCLDRFPCFNLSWLFSCLPCLKSVCCFKHLNCLMRVPQLVIDDHTEPLFRNLMALEQCHYPSNTYICNYVLLLDSLITTKADVCLLVEKKVIDNRRGSSEAVTTLVNKLGHQIIENKSCYHDIYQRLNEHCDDSWNRLVASLTSVYFRDFWRGTATIAGILVLGFTFGNFLRPFVMKH